VPGPDEPFSFLQREWPDVYDAATRAEAGAYPDPRTSWNPIVNHLTEHGLMEAALLYESPFTDLTPHGPNGLFENGQVEELVATLATVRATAVAA